MVLKLKAGTSDKSEKPRMLIKRKEVLTHATTRMNLEHSAKSKKLVTKTIHCRISFI